MIKHIVFWTLKKEAHGMDKAGLARKIKQDLEALVPLIPEIQDLEVGINEVPSDAACDVCLLSSFATWEDLDTYRTHPDHQAVVCFVKEAVTGRHVVDYEI